VCDSLRVAHEEVEVRTRSRRELVDVTARVTEVVRASGVRSGTCVLHVGHTTAGLFANENADPSVASDILDRLATLVPDRGRYSHLEGNSPAHIMASIVGSSVTVPVVDGEPALGRWQGIFLAEFDGPRARRMLVTVMGARG